MNGIQEVSGSIPLISTNKDRVFIVRDENPELFCPFCTDAAREMRNRCAMSNFFCGMGAEWLQAEECKPKEKVRIGKTKKQAMSQWIRPVI